MAKKLTKRPRKLKKEEIPQEEHLNQIAHYQMLLMNQGWNLLTEMMQHEVDTIEHVILTKRDIETGTTLPEALLDIMRVRREIFTEIISKPRQMIAQLEQKAGNIIPEYDPFYQNYKDIGRRREDFEETSPHTLRM
jgi:predicted phosphoribosyltransferase